MIPVRPCRAPRGPVSLFHSTDRLPDAAGALPGRATPLGTGGLHAVLGTPMTGPFPALMQTALFGLGCCCGAERRFWRVPGGYTTSVVYAGFYTHYHTCRVVCSGQTGHAEVVQAVFEHEKADFETLLKTFWEAHDPTQGVRQGNVVGTQYRSVLY